MKYKEIMKLIPKKLVVLAIFMFFAEGFLFSQSFSIDNRSVGLILNDSKILGTGFVFENKNQVITCAHVVFNHDKFQYRTTDDSFYELEVSKVDTIGDIAYLRSKNEICEKPLLLGNAISVNNGDIIFYIGFDSANSKELGNKSLLVNYSNIIAKGEQLNYTGSAEFIEFIGVGKPGYSGGPVFNRNGKLMGVMREAWHKRGLKGGEEILINRAFLLTP